MKVSVVLGLVAAMVLWAACFPLLAVGLDLAPHLAFAAMRAALAGLGLLVLGAVLRRRVPRGGRVWGLILLVALGSTTLGFLGMFHAAEFLSPGIATVIANAQPLLAVILARAFLGERLEAMGKTGLAAGFARRHRDGMAGPRFWQRERLRARNRLRCPFSGRRSHG